MWSFVFEAGYSIVWWFLHAIGKMPPNSDMKKIEIPVIITIEKLNSEQWFARRLYPLLSNKF